MDSSQRPNLNGMGYVYYYSKDELSPRRVAAMLRRLNVKSVRVWSHIRWLLTDPVTVNRPLAEAYHEMYALLKAAGVTQIVGMSHYWFFPEGMHMPAGECSCVPLRDTAPGSDYQRFLELYEASWRTLAAEFPEVTDWETGNEFNHKVFLSPAEPVDETGRDWFTIEERADICTDMMFRAARGIRSVRPDAGIIMPGMAPVGERGEGVYATSIAAEYDGMIRTLRRIYENIHSSAFGSANPRDFFDQLAWHPYYAEQEADGSWRWRVPDEKWVAVNKAVYNVAVEAGDAGVGCCLTEWGFNDWGTEEADESLVTHVREGLRLIRERMPFVSTVHAYRFYDSMGYVSEEKDNYAFFTMKNGLLTAKKRALALQEAYGGSGPLTETDNTEKETGV